MRQISILSTLLILVGCLHAQPQVKGYKRTDISDMVLIYQGGTHRKNWTEEQFLPYVRHKDAYGKQDWLFDGFLFLEFKDGNGRCYASRYEKLGARKQEWIWLTDRIFEKGKALSALNACIESQIKQLGAPSFKHKIVIGLPEPIPGQRDWGELDGKQLDFSNDKDKEKACLWHIEELIRKFKEANLPHLDLAGFYWVAEDIVTSKALTIPLGEYIRSRGFKFYWIPYWNAMGYSEWKELGFDVAYAQPNHFFNASISDDRIDKTCELARTHNLGLEVEFDERAYADRENSFHDRLVTYLDRYERNGVYKEAAIAYYEGGGVMIGFDKSKNPKDKRLMDKMTSFIWKRREAKEAIQDIPVIGLNTSDWIVSPQSEHAVIVRSKQERLYGKVTVQARLLSERPDTKISFALRPATPISGSNAQNGEITLMEYDGSYPGIIKGGMCSEKLNRKTGNKKETVLPIANLSGDYHSFSCEWTPECIKLYVDGVLFFCMDDDFDKNPEYWPFNQPFYLEIQAESKEKGSLLKVGKVSFL